MTASIMNHLEIEMTHDNDLIRRGDVLNLPTYDGDGDPSGTFDHKIFVKLEAIAALPAVAASQTADPVTNADSRQPEQMYLICKYGGYYRPNCRGYTSSIDEAGRYTLAEAERETHPNGPDGPRDGMTYIPSPPVNADSRQRVVVEDIAKIVHEAMRYLRKDGSYAWVDGGNSFMQVEARRAAARILAAIDVQPDPRDAQIERLVGAAEKVASWDHCWPGNINLEREIGKMRAALAAVKGGAA